MSGSNRKDFAEAPTSSGEAKNSEGYSVPSESNVATGRRLLNKYIRSIVMSRTAFSLFHGFNPSKTSIGYGKPVPNFTVFQPGEEHYRELLLKCFKGTDKEVNITKRMGSHLKKVLKNQNNVTTFVEAEVPISSNKKKCPRLDVAWGDKIGGSLIGFVEVGLTPRDTPDDALNEKVDQLFWKKVDQAIKYLDLVSEKGVNGKTEDDEEFELKVDLRKTLLLGVIVMTRTREFGRIAIFACEPKKDKTWRMALMWRKEGGKKDISHAFGFYAAAIKYMADNDFNLDGEPETWKYMGGPNCSKVTITGTEESTSVVLRSYDNRVRQTSRSPCLYHNWNKISADTKVVVDWKESNDTTQPIEFRDTAYSQQNTLFRSDGKAGKLEVISVPFVPGEHYCSSAQEALSMVHVLKDMHESGFIHGDIRALNCVFAGEKSAMIDLDFGGTEQDSYPPGYKTALRDGSRGSGLAGLQGQKLSKQEDVNALKYIFTSLHRPGKEVGASLKEIFTDDLEDATSLNDVEEVLAQMCPDNSPMPMRPMKAFARFVQECTDERDKSTKQTLPGDTATPERENILPSKRSASAGT